MIGYHAPTCAKCSQNLTSQQQQQQPTVTYFQTTSASVESPAVVTTSTSALNQQAMPPPLYTNSTRSNNNPQPTTAHHHKKSSSSSSSTSNQSTMALEQALMGMESEILIGEEGECPLCHKVFNRKTSFLNHIRNHSAEKKWVCNYCHKGFSQQANLRNHERIHTNDRPYVCIDCGKAFTQITNLNNHRRIHTGERPFVCIEPDCGRSFAQVTNLNCHMKTHHKIQQYVCSHCPNKYHTVTQLNQHLGTHGVQVKTQIAPRGNFGCQICPTFFHDEIQLKRHLRRHAEGNLFPCTIDGCPENFSSKNQLNRHLQNQHLHEMPKRKESRQVPLSLLQLTATSPKRFKVENEIRNCVIQLPDHHATAAAIVNLSSPYSQQFVTSEHLLSNSVVNNSEATKKVLSEHLSNFNHFLNSFSHASPAAIAIPNTASKQYICHICSNVFKTSQTLTKHIERYHR